ncbi:50S ribosome-binding GTPase [Ignisphaera sp. 4213-co]|uniref:50S ribosome-binding GTPase n=1 Tax=Ignisphaera cupida TaxID=3050454 RepID=A0ABD4ZAJ1_9CREN|nr:GTPase [Ignisphaera sp. 4213-co]MDK6029108.1 50S ribosome-binding GTPase [Ignisphaera sp. 4213-co]
MGMESVENEYCLSNYVNIEPLSLDTIRKRVLDIYVESVDVSKNIVKLDPEKRTAFRYMLKSERVFQYVATTLGKIARLPPKENLNSFYADLLDIATHGRYNELRKQASLAVKVISSMWKEYRSKILSSGLNAKNVSREFVGRILSIVKRKVKLVELTKEISYVAKNTPCIDFSKPLIIVAGMPQVGKSTFVGAVSSAKPKVSPYPFTTKNVIIGHIKLGEVVIQVMDTPGILDRPIKEMNDIERRAVAALRNLKAVVLYFMDPSPDAYYSFEQQVAVLKNVEELIGKEKIIVVFNKIDKLSKELLEKHKKVVMGMGYSKLVEISALHKINVWTAIAFAIERFDALFNTTYLELLKLYSSSTTSISGVFSSLSSTSS